MSYRGARSMNELSRQSDEIIILSGTKGEICHELIAEFNIAKNEAYFMFYLNALLHDDNQFDKNSASLEDCDEQNYNRYKTQLFNLNYNMDFSELKMDIYKALYKLPFIFVGENIGMKEDERNYILAKCAFGFILDVGISFVKNLTKVPNECLCIYYNAMEKYRTSRVNLFSKKDLYMYDCNYPYECKYRGSKLNCIYMKNDNCTMTPNKFNQLFKLLQEKNIFKCIDENCIENENCKWRII